MNTESFWNRADGVNASFTKKLTRNDKISVIGCVIQISIWMK